MKLEVMKNAVTSKAARQILIARKHSPAVMFGAGVVGVVGTTVLACRATLKVEDLLEDADKKREQIKFMVHEKYSEKDRQKDLRYHQIQTLVGVGKLYAPAVGVGVISVGLLTGSHVVLTRRNVALTAAYKALEEGYNKYRERVREEYGEEKERELHRGVQTMTLHDTKKGEINHKKFVNPGGGPPSPYAVFFDEHNKNWTQGHPEYNMLFLRANQEYANDRLRAKGHVFLNDVLRDLGFEDTKAGAVTGWIKNQGDGHIDFGIFDQTDKFYDFIHGDEGIWLDFNVDGTIYDKI